MHTSGTWLTKNLFPMVAEVTVVSTGLSCVFSGHVHINFVL